MGFTLRMFDDLLTTLPRRNTYEHVIARRLDPQLAISDLYREFIRLGLRVMKTFGRGKVSKWYLAQTCDLNR